MKWLPPHRAFLENDRYCDFLYGSFPEIVVSERVKTAYEASGLKGIKNFYPLEILKVRRKRKNSPPKPEYYVVEIGRIPARLEMLEVEWDEPPKCEVCLSGIAKRVKGLRLIEETWTGEDIFLPITFPREIIVTQRFVDFVLDNGFSNAEFVPLKDYELNF
jgi:hypothetical protein